MKFTLFATAAATLALASTPAFAQLAGSGNLISTSATPPAGPNSPHQSTTMVNGGGGTRGVLAGVNGGDAAPGVKTSKLVVLPAGVRNQTADRSVGGWVEAGASKGSVTQQPTVRTHVDNNLGAGPNSTSRTLDLNLPTGGNGAGKAAAGGLASNVTGAVPK